MIGKVIEGAKTPEEVRKRLDDADLLYSDLTKECGYFNLHIPFMWGHYRVYMAGRKIKTQTWRKTKLQYSGISTFEPSGRHSF